MSENVVPLHKHTDPPADTAAVTTLTVVPDAPPARPVPLWVRSGRAVKTAVTHERTRSAGRSLVRHTLYTFNGGRIVARRAWDGRTGGASGTTVRGVTAAVSAGGPVCLWRGTTFSDMLELLLTAPEGREFGRAGVAGSVERAATPAEKGGLVTTSRTTSWPPFRGRPR